MQGRLDLAKYITMPQGELAGRVLLVDDLADSGVTLRAVVERLRGMPAITELRSAVIWTKGVSSYMPDYYVELLPTSPWIHQPFEEYDGLRPEGWRGSSRSEAVPALRLAAAMRRRGRGIRHTPISRSLRRRIGNKKAALRRLALSTWCPGEDSNLHGVTR